MSRIEAQDGETDDEGKRSLDQALEEALELDFASLQEVKDAFRS